MLDTCGFASAMFIASAGALAPSYGQIQLVYTSPESLTSLNSWVFFLFPFFFKKLVILFNDITILSIIANKLLDNTGLESAWHKKTEVI